MGSLRSKEDEVSKVSTSFFVSNFPDQFTAKELWNACRQYGNVVDAFIPNRRSKAGKRFGFVRFIKFFDVYRLVNNLCTIWIGRYKLHTNVARFQRMHVNKGSNYAKENKGDFRNSTGVGTWFTQLVQASKELTIDERVTWVEIEGVPIKLWSENTFNRIASKWGLLLNDGENEDEGLHRKRLCISTKDIKEGKIKGEYGESPFLEGDSDVYEVPETIFAVDSHNGSFKEVSMGKKDSRSEDPFNIYELLNKNKRGDNKSPCVDDSLKYPPGFTPVDVTEGSLKKDDGFNKEDGECSQSIHVDEKEDVAESFCSGQFKKFEAPRTGGSIVQLIDDLVKVGNWGGILCVWDPRHFNKSNATISDYFVMIMGVWVPSGEVIIMGDFNEVRTKDERFGSEFNKQGAEAFNMFISNTSLEEVPLGGCSFTWCYKSTTKMSKLNRFFISESLMSYCPNISAVSLDRYLSDHRPILLREAKYDYGPISFRFFHYWFEVEGLDKLVEDTWNEAPADDSNAMSRMLKRLKYLKEKLRTWNKEKKRMSSNSKVRLQEELCNLDIIIDKGESTVDVVNRRSFVIKSLQDTENLQSAVWDCGTDKSPGPDGFTFGFYRRFWKVIEKYVVEAVTFFFCNGYFPKGGNSSFIALIPKKPDTNMVKDFRPISLIGSLYKIIAKVLANRLMPVLGNIFNEVQLAFIADRQILDGPFILNEIVQWCKSRKKQSMIFKVDFEKAYDSVRWDFLDDILKNFGFGERWRGWISGCLRYSRGSVIVNGSPTNKFQFYKGLKQGDPLSHFLFLLVMESLHIHFKELWKQ
nr:RNA-directed DNA polymerase, eukaryota, reverse transcriptase zinc-binding domain protein [Tanacetum cinerariifolium]